MGSMTNKFESMSKESKIELIDKIFDLEIRSALREDGGGVEIIGIDGWELYIAYQGACSSCSAAIGGTLYFMQDILQQRIDSRLKIVPME
jgi:Fe-S cluster biogenesis protein NfuA